MLLVLVVVVPLTACQPGEARALSHGLSRPSGLAQAGPGPGLGPGLGGSLRGSEPPASGRPPGLRVPGPTAREALFTGKLATVTP
jgi:hypothetical protein